jgi:hypothetical protein
MDVSPATAQLAQVIAAERLAEIVDVFELLPDPRALLKRPPALAPLPPMM